MELPDISVSKKSVKDFVGDLLVVFAAKESKEDEKIITDPLFQGILDNYREFQEFKADCDQTLLLYPPYSSEKASIGCKRVLFVGLGALSEISEDSEKFEVVRIAGGHLALACNKSKIDRMAILLPGKKTIPGLIGVASFCHHFLEGFLLGMYRFDKYKSLEKKEKEPQYPGVSRVSLLNGHGSSLKKAVSQVENSAVSVWKARDMANEPGNGWTPEHFADFARELSRKDSVSCTVLEKKQMLHLGMGGILAVNQGSQEEPKCVILDYKPPKYNEKSHETLLLVGKGLTFDSGGISLKPAQGMKDMKYDMCGGAAAISAMIAVAEELPPLRVVCIVPSTDNMAGGGAVKPGDIITHYGGITSEIDNTDAEGRLILADALAYGIEKYSPCCVVDLATLTGAVIIALGHHHTGLMANNDALAERLRKAGAMSGEPIWRLPLGKEYAKQIKSTVADLKNTGGRPAGSITAAEYLHRFVDKTPWAHLDIAGTAWDFTEKSYIPKGPSGIGVRTLIEFIRSWKNGRFSN